MLILVFSVFKHACFKPTHYSVWLFADIKEHLPLSRRSHLNLIRSPTASPSPDKSSLRKRVENYKCKSLYSQFVRDAYFQKALLEINLLITQQAPCHDAFVLH